MSKLINELMTHRTLSQAEARQVLVDMATGAYNPSELAAFMTVYLMRAITLNELQGFRDAMLELCVPVNVEQPVMDVCGTGGDGRHTFNISTLSAFVVAAAGQPVAKHGNYGVSSACGSSNVLEFLGHRFTRDISTLKRSLDQANICFLHAPLFHPAMKHVGPVRKALGVKTFFNMLGPLVNPAFPQRQFAGVFSLELARQYGYLFQRTDMRFMVVHDLEGYDEVSLTGSCKTFTRLGEHVLTPDEITLAPVHANDIRGGTSVEESANVFLDILQGRGTPAQQRVVVANAALALSVGMERSLADMILLSGEVLRSGKAYTAFQTFMRVNS
jgi:anthranilate phosphoribosyltransferase